MIFPVRPSLPKLLHPSLSAVKESLRTLLHDEVIKSKIENYFTTIHLSPSNEP